MHIERVQRGAFGAAEVRLDPGDVFVSEAGAMVHCSANVEIDVTTRSRGKGGIAAGVKRLVGGDSFFLSTYRVRDGRPGIVGLAPTLQGDVEIVELDGRRSWLCAGGSYLGSGADVQLDTQFQGFKGLFSGESLFFLQASGRGPLLVAAFGRIDTIRVQGPVTVDTGHVVAFEDSLNYQISKAGGSWLQSFLAGEGVVMTFSGSGRLLVQSHNPREFGRWLGPRLPARS